MPVEPFLTGYTAPLSVSHDRDFTFQEGSAAQVHCATKHRSR